MIYLKIVVLIVCYLVLYYVFGDVFLNRIKCGRKNFGMKIIVGFFLYYLCFQLIALPLKTMLCSLTLLIKIWVVFCAAVLICFIGKKTRKKKKFELRKPELEKQNLLKNVFLLFLISFQIFSINLNQYEGSAADEAFYIGTILQDVETDTIEQYNPYTGEKNNTLDTEYYLETNLTHSAVMCKLFDIAPLIERRTVMTSVVIILATFIIYEIGMSLFQGKSIKVLWFMLFYFGMIFLSDSMYNSASFYIYRTNEGKTVLANIILPATYLFFINIQEAWEKAENWILLFLMIVAGYGLNMSMLFIEPIVLSGLFIPLAISRKSWKIFVRYCICMIPCVLVIVYYIGCLMGKFQIQVL